MSLPVSHIMRSNVVFCEESTSLIKVSEMIIRENVGSILVSHGEKSTGIITTNDLLRAILNGLDFATTRAGEIMSHPLVTCDAEDSLEHVLKLFEETGRNRLVVMLEGRVVGLLRKATAERFKGVAGLYSFSPKTRSLPFRRGSGSSTS
jgi:CBS domain-containing protein